jgi:hypothetical protein
MQQHNHLPQNPLFESPDDLVTEEEWAQHLHALDVAIYGGAAAAGPLTAAAADDMDYEICGPDAIIAAGGLVSSASGAAGAEGGSSSHRALGHHPPTGARTPAVGTPRGGQQSASSLTAKVLNPIHDLRKQMASTAKLQVRMF